MVTTIPFERILPELLLWFQMYMLLPLMYQLNSYPADP